MKEIACQEILSQEPFTETLFTSENDVINGHMALQAKGVEPNWTK